MDEKINIQNIVQLLMEKNEIDANDADVFVKAVFDLIEEGLEADGIVKIKGLGTFKLTGVERRESIDVNTGERISIDSHTKVSFVPDLQMRDLINKPFSYFETVLLNDGVVFDDMPATQPEQNVVEEQQDETGEIPESQNEEILSTAEENQVENKPLQIDTPQLDTRSEPEQVIITELVNDEVTDNPQEELIEQETDIPDQTNNILQPDIASNPIDSETIADLEEMDNPSHSPAMRYLGVGVAVMLLSIILFVMYHFYQQNHAVLKLDNMAPVALTDSISQTLPSENNDSLALIQDTIQKVVAPAMPPIDTTRTIITGVRKGRESVIPDSTSYRIVGTMTNYKIKRGETLTMVSRRFYETKDLWPYLVMHNRDIITNPNNVPSGTVIRIPALRNK